MAYGKHIPIIFLLSQAFIYLIISYHTTYHSGPDVNLIYFTNVYSNKICIMVLKNSFVKIMWQQNL